jgi:hypothetical protein
MTTMTPAAHAYVMRLYEIFVDKDLDLEDIRRALATHGIRRNIHQIEFDLNERYCFAGYAASHQPKPRLTLAQLQAQEEDKRGNGRKGTIRLPDGRYVRPAVPAAAH